MEYFRPPYSCLTKGCEFLVHSPDPSLFFWFQQYLTITQIGELAELNDSSPLPLSTKSRSISCDCHTFTSKLNEFCHFPTRCLLGAAPPERLFTDGQSLTHTVALTLFSLFRAWQCHDCPREQHHHHVSTLRSAPLRQQIPSSMTISGSSATRATETACYIWWLDVAFHFDLFLPHFIFRILNKRAGASLSWLSLSGTTL